MSPPSSSPSSPPSSSSSTPGSQLLLSSPSRSLQPLSPPPSRQSRRQRPIFLVHYLWRNKSSVVYDPFSDRWHRRLVPPFPTASSGSHLLIMYECFYDYRVRNLNDMVSNFFLFDPLSNIATAVPLPQLGQSHFSLSLVFHDDNNYKVIVFPWLASNIQIFDSRRRSWTSCALPPTFNLTYLVNSLFCNGLLYVLSLQPNRVSIVNLETGNISIVEDLPLITCTHLMVFEGRFFLTGFAVPQRNAPDIVSIQVWEIFRSERVQWRLVSIMPHELLQEFCQNCDVGCHGVCSGDGIICFFHFLSHRLVMYDFVAGTWKAASPSPFFDNHKVVWLGLALEPTPDEHRRYYNSR